jgi:hypothetical protein
MKYCESTFIRWHQCSWFQQNVGIPVVEFAVSNTTDNNLWENCILLDLKFSGLCEPRNLRKLEPRD